MCSKTKSSFIALLLLAVVYTAKQFKNFHIHFIKELPSNNHLKYAHALYGVDDVKVTCGNDKANYPEYQAFDVYKGLMGHLIYDDDIQIDVPRISFSVGSVVCYVTSYKCDVRLNKLGDHLSSVKMANGINIANRVVSDVKKAMSDLKKLGWLYQYDMENICINNGASVLLTGFESTFTNSLAEISPDNREGVMHQMNNSILDALTNIYHYINPKDGLSKFMIILQTSLKLSFCGQSLYQTIKLLEMIAY
ncbi:hypothetical protein BDF19DRAFT_413582 [Syncephalis fuscata]|nr:hypothetical protein BDF19DRAFT_413582 [Syncephalis fuscata]